MVAIPAAYQPSDGTTIEWRIYPPGYVYIQDLDPPTPTPTPTPAAGPCILVIHGGNWNAGDPFQVDIVKVCEVLAQEGFWVFSADYRLAPCGRITKQPGHKPTPTPAGTPTPTPDPSGRPPEQTDDVMYLMMAIRASSHCNGKVGVLGSSVGGFLATYAAVYPDTINITGRPHWVPSQDRPTCLATFSSPFDLADQLPSDVDQDTGFAKYLRSLQNYVGSCDIEVARVASPVYQINRAAVTDFRAMFIVQAEQDDTNPPRQLDDIVNALKHAQVDPCNYVVTYMPSDQGGGHALILWTQHDPNYPDCPTHTIGDSAIAFFHQNLDH